MTERDTCPDIIVLSSFLDGELEGRETEGVKVHIENCPGCAKRMKDLNTTGHLMINNLGRPIGSSERSRSADCMNGETLCLYFHELLSTEERSTAELHLNHCDACLSELAAMARTEWQLCQTPTELVPGHLRAKVETFWNKPEKATDQILRVVCRVAQDGIEFLRDSLLPQGLTFQQGFAASGVYRAVGQPSLPPSIFVKGNISGIQLGLSVEWERADRAGLRLKIEDEESHPLSAQRILLRREQILLYSERTDANGRAAVPNLEPGTYQIGIVIPGKEFTIDVEIRHN